MLHSYLLSYIHFIYFNKLWFNNSFGARKPGDLRSYSNPNINPLHSWGGGELLEIKGSILTVDKTMGKQNTGDIRTLGLSKANLRCGNTCWLTIAADSGHKHVKNTSGMCEGLLLSGISVTHQVLPSML